MPTLKTIHGIDPYAEGGIDALLEFHRGFWGDAQMNADDDSADDEDNDGGDDSADDENNDAGDDDGDAGDDDVDKDGEEALGDKGKKALDAMKAKWRAERKAAREAQAELKKLRQDKAAADKPDAEKERQRTAQEAQDKAIQLANKRIVKAEVKSAAAGKLANPALAIKLLDLEEIEVDDDGNVDEDAINDLIAELLEENPYLAAQGGGTAKFDSARGKQRRGSTQLKQSDLKNMSPEAIEKARKEGRLDRLMGK